MVKYVVVLCIFSVVSGQCFGMNSGRRSSLGAVNVGVCDADEFKAQKSWMLLVSTTWLRKLEAKVARLININMIQIDLLGIQEYEKLKQLTEELKVAKTHQTFLGRLRRDIDCMKQLEFQPQEKDGGFTQLRLMFAEVDVLSFDITNKIKELGQPFCPSFADEEYEGGSDSD